MIKDTTKDFLYYHEQGVLIKHDVHNKVNNKEVRKDTSKCHNDDLVGSDLINTPLDMVRIITSNLIPNEPFKTYLYYYVQIFLLFDRFFLPNENFFVKPEIIMDSNNNTLILLPKNEVVFALNNDVKYDRIIHNEYFRIVKDLIFCRSNHGSFVVVTITNNDVVVTIDENANVNEFKVVLIRFANFLIDYQAVKITNNITIKIMNNLHIT